MQPAAPSAITRALASLSLIASLLYQFVKGQPYPWNVLWKGLSISPLALAAILAVPGRDGALLAAALGLSSLGDILLDLQPQQFTAGLGAFLTAHVVYIALFLRHRAARIPLTRLLVIAAAVVYAALFANRLMPALSGGLKIPVLVYLCVITGMFAAATISSFRPWVMLGALLFLFSDSVLAADKFLGKVPNREWLVWPSYYLAQCFLAYGVWEASRRR